jgi:DNA primase
VTRGPHDGEVPRIGAAERSVPIANVLQAAGVLGTLRRRGDRLVGPCPVHGGDNLTAFSVDLRTNRWYCFTRCAGGGDVVELVRRLHRVGFREAAAVLAALTSSDLAPAVVGRPSASHGVARPFRPFRTSIPLDADSAFLRAKGISGTTAAAHEVGQYRGGGWLKGCVGLRVHDPAGAPIGYLGRSLAPGQCARWKVPPGLPKAHILYNYHRAARGGPPPVLTVTECPWGVLRLAQLDVPAVALLGVHLSATQRDLVRRSPRVRLLLDGDDAGMAAADRIRDALVGLAQTEVVRLPTGLDPDDLCDDELLALLPS